jgi:hypothetical protein
MANTTIIIGEKGKEIRILVDDIEITGEKNKEAVLKLTSDIAMLNNRIIIAEAGLTIFQTRRK